MKTRYGAIGVVGVRGLLQWSVLCMGYVQVSKILRGIVLVVCVLAELLSVLRLLLLLLGLLRTVRVTITGHDPHLYRCHAYLSGVCNSRYPEADGLRRLVSHGNCSVGISAVIWPAGDEAPSRRAVESRPTAELRLRSLLRPRSPSISPEISRNASSRARLYDCGAGG